MTLSALMTLDHHSVPVCPSDLSWHRLHGQREMVLVLDGVKGSVAKRFRYNTGVHSGIGG